MTFTETSVCGIPEYYIPRCRKKKSKSKKRNKSKKWVNHPTKPKTAKFRKETALCTHEKTAQKQDLIDSLHWFQTCNCTDCKSQRIDFWDSFGDWWSSDEQEELKRKRTEEDEAYYSGVISGLDPAPLRQPQFWSDEDETDEDEMYPKGLFLRQPQFWSDEDDDNLQL